MICNNVIDKGHLFISSNKYIVDTNVLISLYGNKFYAQQIKTNAKLNDAVNYYNKALNQGCTVFVPAIVLSEFINLFLSCQWKELRAKDPNKYKDKKKDYRDTPEYIKDCNYIKGVIEQSILSVLTPIDDDFSLLSSEQMFKFDNDDFNDRLIIHIANKNNLYVISADVDVKKIAIK